MLPVPSNLTVIDAATLCLVNRIRALHGLRGLQPNAELARVARAQVSVMVRWNYFADVRPTGQTPLALVAATRYPARASFSVGQNIAWGTGPNATAAHTMAAWMESPPHRAIILSGDFRDAGVAVTPSVPAAIGRGRGGATYAIVFGVRRQ